MADDGRAFFATKDALVPRDQNGEITDVYEYVGGRPQLITLRASGRATSPAAARCSAPSSRPSGSGSRRSAMTAATSSSRPTRPWSTPTGTANSSSSTTPERAAASTKARGSLPARPPTSAMASTAAAGAAGRSPPAQQTGRRQPRRGDREAQEGEEEERRRRSAPSRRRRSGTGAPVHREGESVAEQGTSRAGLRRRAAGAAADRRCDPRIGGRRPRGASPLASRTSKSPPTTPRPAATPT